MIDPQSQEKFRNEIIEKVHSDITKFILDTNYSNAQ